MAIEIPRTKNHSENSDRTGANRDGYMPCIVCGRAVNMGKDRWMVYVHGGGTVIISDEEEAEFERTEASGNCGGYPIGPDCLKRHPEIKPYANRVRAMPRYEA